MHKLLISNALRNMQCLQEHWKTIVNAKLVGGGGGGEHTKCIMENSKIENTEIQL